jgi:HAD superfamily hydrolase (TIGR01509 family)
VTAIRAVVFDLYGTLLHIRDTAFQRGIVHLVRAPRRAWVEFLRDVLVVTAYPDREAFVDAVLERFPAADPEAARRRALELLDRELASVEAEPSARTVLGFLRRRGYRLGLLTNSGSPFREPFERAGLAECFDAEVFSAELGHKKPAAAAYRAALAALEVEPAEALMVGDSLPNDVTAPAALGMPTWRIAGSGRAADVPGFPALAWLTGFAEGRLETLLEPGRRLSLGQLEGVVDRVELLPDAQQGRYNLVARVEVTWDRGFAERVFVKRFRHPEAIRIEEFVRPLLGEVGIDTNRVVVLDGREPLLVAREVSGEKLGDAPPDPDLAFEIGRHGASAYLFANADLRPRNAFLQRLGRRPLLTMVDYEYSLFDRALDLSDLPERYDPAALARRPEAELLARGTRRVVTRATIQRTRRAFFDHRAIGAAALDAFRAGWTEVHRAAQEAAGRLEERLRRRLAEEPPLIVGTEAYRRAFLPLDVRDLLDRVATDPDIACDYCF